MDSSEDPSNACVNGDVSASSRPAYRLFNRRASIHQIMGGGKGNSGLWFSNFVIFVALGF